MNGDPVFSHRIARFPKAVAYKMTRSVLDILVKSISLLSSGKSSYGLQLAEKLNKMSSRSDTFCLEMVYTRGDSMILVKNFWLEFV